MGHFKLREDSHCYRTLKITILKDVFQTVQERNVEHRSYSEIQFVKSLNINQTLEASIEVQL